MRGGTTRWDMAKEELKKSRSEQQEGLRRQKGTMGRFGG